MKGMFKTIKRTPHTLGTKVGLSKKSADAEFDEAHRNFAALETSAEKFIKDAKLFVEAVINLFTAGEHWGTHFSAIFHPISGEVDLIGKNPDAELTIKNVDKFKAVQEELRTLVAPELELIESRILAPMKEMKDILKTIRKAITKRDHKLTDYDRFNNSLTKLRDKKEKSLNDEKNLYKLEQDFDVATTEYENINNAMKTELPRFMNLAVEFIDPLFQSFYYMQLNIFYVILEKMNVFVEESKLPVSGDQDIAAEYQNKRTDAYKVIENLNIIKRILSVSRLVQVARANNASGNLSRSNTSMSSTSTASSSRPPPPSAAAYKKPPPPPPSLTVPNNPPPPYSATPKPLASTRSVNGAAATATAAAAKRPPPPPPIKPKPKPAAQYVVALYDFTAQADGDLSFKAGDRIEVVERTASAEDWWTGKLRGQQGVFPGNYVQDA